MSKSNIVDMEQRRKAVAEAVTLSGETRIVTAEERNAEAIAKIKSALLRFADSMIVHGGSELRKDADAFRKAIEAVETWGDEQ